jgi:hypothetical protein
VCQEGNETGRRAAAAAEKKRTRQNGARRTEIEPTREINDRTVRNMCSRPFLLTRLAGSGGEIGRCEELNSIAPGSLFSARLLAGCSLGEVPDRKSSLWTKAPGGRDAADDKTGGQRSVHAGPKTWPNFCSPVCVTRCAKEDALGQQGGGLVLQSVEEGQRRRAERAMVAVRGAPAIPREPMTMITATLLLLLLLQHDQQR